MTLRIKNWEKFQHYKDRNPPWIKLHYEILFSQDWVFLDDQSKLLAIVLMLIASRKKGEVPEDLDYIQQVAHLKKRPNLNPLISSGFIIPSDDCKQLQADASERLHSVSVSVSSSVSSLKEDKGGVGEKGENKFGVEDLMRLWNVRAHANLPRVQILNKQREAHAKARLADWPEPAFWERLIEHVNTSSFLTGLSSRWKCDFDWVLKSSNITKIMEGNYVDNEPTGPGPRNYQRPR